MLLIFVVMFTNIVTLFKINTFQVYVQLYTWILHLEQNVFNIEEKRNYISKIYRKVVERTWYLSPNFATFMLYGLIYLH